MKAFAACAWIAATLTLAFGREYVGSQACRTCHASLYSSWQNHGHACMFRAVQDSQPPSYPFPGFPHLPSNPPLGLSWNQVSAVLGGYWWKARFLDSDGYVITTGFHGGGTQPVQWNCLQQQWSGYEPANPRRRPYEYSCFACHTTGPVAADSADLLHHWQQKPGIWGTWAEEGVGCEACHGPGSAHVQTMSPDSIELDRTAALCGRCHSRTAGQRVAAQPPWVLNRSQYDELLHSPHATMRCVQCHSPHRSVVFSQGGVTSGARCTRCHRSRNYLVARMESIACTDCHMAELGLSAQALNPYWGDLHSHLFQISTAVMPRDSHFYQDGAGFYLRLDSSGRGFIPLDVACLKCHSTQSMEWAHAYAEDIHIRHPSTVSPQPASATPEALELGQNYPNPFNSTTTIPFALPEAGHASLAIYDLLGRQVAQLVDALLPSGAYTATFDGSGLASGVYIARLQLGTGVKTRKLMLLK